ncbi:phage tail length tape measure family protein [Agrobacterium rosae]|uniref:phage tail length tape measure family protein n=1 Tax=Agrobacterium rosae TaxID=1972867 RepID=UPI0019D388CC|nr:phage tail length tape measure family protein [Agrobacterium rosae]MBN7804914.1 phage tail length tape measure family protein [Agrobacterium rosae]
MDIAQLGIEVQSGGVKSATNDLKQFTNASRVAERAASGLSDASSKFSTAEIAAMASAMGNVEKTSNAAAKAMAAVSLAAQRTAAVGPAQAKAIAQSAGAAQQQMRNLAFQFQDIATMMAMGQSPFMLLAQQLPQVTMYGGQLTGVMGALKSTLAGFISPLGLITTGFVLLGTAAISYFSEWFSRGSEANMTLKEQSALIQQVANDWGDAAPQMRAYADEMERAAKAKGLMDAANIASAAQYTAVEDVLARINEEYTAAIRNLRGYGDETNSVVKDLTSSFSDLQSKIMEGNASSEDLKRAQDAVNVAVDQYGTPAVLRYAAAFSTLVPQINAAINAAANFRGEAASMPGLDRMNNPATWRGVGVENPNADGAIQGTQFPLPDNGPTPGSRPLIELEGMPKVRGSGGAKQKAYESATASINEQTRALQAQTAAQQSLNPAINDFGFAVAKAKVETDLLLAAEKDKKAITPELTAQIGAQAEKYAQAVVEQNKFTEATKRANEATQFVKNTTAGFINDLRDGLKNGEGFWSSFGSAALSVLDRITDKLLNEVLDAVFKVSNAGSGGGGGFLSSIFGSLFGGGGKGYFPAAPTGSMYASGTASARAGMALVGEKGPEIVRFGGGEQVVPNNQLGNGFVGSRQAANANTPQSMHVTVGVSVDQDGNLQAYVKDVARSESAKISTAVVKQNEKNKRNLQQNGQAA